SGGSDAPAIKSLAIKADNGWTLSGHKSWISNAAAADILSVYANTDPSNGWRGIACFLIDADLAGVKRGQTYDLMGGHALGTGEFAFDKVALSTEDLFLPTERAFKEAMAGIDLARVNVAAMACGMLSSALAQAISYAQTREVFGQAVAELQGPQWQLADVATDLAAARALTYQAANALKADADATILSAHAKKFATRMALERISDCMQVMGAAGFRTDRSLGRHLACAKMAQYLDGTTEIQNVVISRGFARRNEP
ncbi:MAG: acyl-CoA dehydrogenase family protein, partial [Pseudomonadales bacterium]